MHTQGNNDELHVAVLVSDGCIISTSFNEQILPILPAVGQVYLVVGCGNHSDGGIAKLKPALKKYLENHQEQESKRQFQKSTTGRRLLKLFG